MPLDADDILEMLQESARSQDQTVDVAKGPLYDWVYAPTAQGLAEVAAGTDRVRQLYSARFARVADEAEALAFSENYGVGRDIGTAATGFQTFYTFTKPVSGEVRTVPPGSIVRRSSDGRGFRVLPHTLTMTGDSANAFFSARNGWYELTVPVEALSVGPEFDTPAGLVNQLDNAISGFDGTINKSDIDGGLTAESSSDTIDRTQSALLGNDFGTHGGIMRSVLVFDRAVRAVSLAFFTEYNLFQRRSFKPALDVYVIGTKVGNRGRDIRVHSRSGCVHIVETSSSECVISHEKRWGCRGHVGFGLEPRVSRLVPRCGQDRVRCGRWWGGLRSHILLRLCCPQPTREAVLHQS
jgi:hypothetical protein